MITVDEPSLSITVGINTSPLAGKDGRQADRAADPRPARPGAGRQRLDPGPRDRAARHLGGRGARRAPARRPAGDDAARGLRADRGPAAGGHPRDGRQAPRAGRAARDRRARGLRRGRHPGAGGAQGADGADGQPLDRLGAARVPGAGAGADRLPDRVPDRDPRDRPHAPRLRGLGAVGRGAPTRGRPARWSPTGSGRPRPSPYSGCRSEGRCSSAPERTSTRGW